jgi:integrase/recombinase XerD
LFGRKPTITKHRSAPLLKEREQFLLYLLRRGVSVKYVRLTSLYLLHIVDVLKLRKLRVVTREELAIAFRKDLMRRRRLTPGLVGVTSSYTLERMAMRFLNFHGKLRRRRGHQPFLRELNNFAEYLVRRQLSAMTVSHYRSQTAIFLRWYPKKKRRVSDLSLRDVDRFVAVMKANGWTPVSMNTMIRNLRKFFRYAEEVGWCSSGLSKGIFTRNRVRVPSPPQGRTWDEVQRLLKSINGSDLASVRAKAMISLVATYALRSRELQRLTPLDFDWDKKILIIHRSKRGPAQRYPLHADVAQYVLNYLRLRPICSCEQLFVTLEPPYRPITKNVVCIMIAHRLKRIGITTGHLGPHAIRHARATQLLQDGMSLRQVSDFLGHRCLDATLIYAKFDLKLLKPVANFSLRGLL